MDGANCLGIAVTTEETHKDIQLISLMESIRTRSWMYLNNPKEPIIDILGIFTDSFLHLKITEFTICEEPKFYIIKSKQDWLSQKNDRNIEWYFNELIGIKNTFRGLQAEVFLTAFYFPFYTTGNAGEYGNQELFNPHFDEGTKERLRQYGRVLIISKEQQLPKDHGINFEQPEKTLSELVNERNWLDIAIQQAKLNE